MSIRANNAALLPGMSVRSRSKMATWAVTWDSRGPATAARPCSIAARVEVPDSRETLRRREDEH
jgi:hypothetical protein